MTPQSTKELLRSFSTLKGKCKIVTVYSQITSSDQYTISDEVLQIFLLKTFVETCLTVVTEEEKFVIESHLIKHLSWLQTGTLFEQRWGQEHMRSERTLKRMQTSALHKITDFINEYELENYIFTGTAKSKI